MREIEDRLANAVSQIRWESDRSFDREWALKVAAFAMKLLAHETATERPNASPERPNTDGETADNAP
jgi:hypothetical protein